MHLSKLSNRFIKVVRFICQSCYLYILPSAEPNQAKKCPRFHSFLNPWIWVRCAFGNVGYAALYNADTKWNKCLIRKIFPAREEIYCDCQAVQVGTSLNFEDWDGCVQWSGFWFHQICVWSGIRKKQTNRNKQTRRGWTTWLVACFLNGIFHLY